MKIIKHGDLKRLDTVRRFTCSACGCVWDANKNEYRVEFGLNESVTVCECPTCGLSAYDGRRIVKE
jgi:RNase P subunit RPR2